MSLSYYYQRPGRLCEFRVDEPSFSRTQDEVIDAADELLIFM